MGNTAIFSGVKVGEQPWKPGKKISSFALCGAVSIDFRKAELEEGKIEISALSILGATRIIVPAGIRINLSGLSFFGGKRSKLTHTEKTTASATKEMDINATSIFGAFEVTD